MLPSGTSQSATSSTRFSRAGKCPAISEKPKVPIAWQGPEAAMVPAHWGRRLGSRDNVRCSRDVDIIRRLSERRVHEPPDGIQGNETGDPSPPSSQCGDLRVPLRIGPLLRPALPAQDVSIL